MRFYRLIRSCLLGLGLGLLFITYGAAQSVNRARLGIGPMIGDPTGVSVKYWQSANTAYQFGGAWSFVGEGAVHFHGDFLVHNWALLGQQQPTTSIYYGLGFRVKLEQHFRLGFRMPLGIAFQFSQAPLDFFLEIAPIMDLLPATQLRMNGGFGIRYYFRL